LIIATWVARNVILSGYIAYPVSQIDLFSFDWKIPEEVAIAQDNYIKTIGRSYLRNLVYRYSDFNRDPLLIIYLTISMYLLLFFSAMPVAYRFIKEKRQRMELLNPIFIATILTLLLWFVKGPDARFVHGIICAMIMYNLSMLVTGRKKYPRLGTVMVGFVTLAFISWSVVFFAQHYKEAVTDSKGRIKYELSEILYKPYPYRYAVDAQGEEFPAGQPYYVGDRILIHIFSHGLVLDRIPCAMDFDYTKGRFIDYTKIENRGNRIEDGFRYLGKGR
jgi:hypothetical protein